MTIKIKRLSEDAFNRLVEDCTNKIIMAMDYLHEGTYDVTLNRNAIFKVNGSRIVIDLAGKISVISANEFLNIEIT